MAGSNPQQKPKAPPPLALSDVLLQEYVAIHGPLPTAVEASVNSPGNARPELTLQRANFDAGTTALCLSGGGIRSASFCLGAVQGLARLGILGKFHYLSTVSGGGYLGSMLAAWAYRAPGGMADVEAGLAAPPDAGNVGWLREYLRYLSPKRGLFGADTWTLITTYVRNLLLNALVWFPMLAGLLTLPHLIVAAVDGIAGRWKGTPALDSLAEWALVLGLVLFGVATLLTRFVVGRVDRDPMSPTISWRDFRSARTLVQRAVEFIGPNNAWLQAALMVGVLVAACGTYWSGYEEPFTLWADLGSFVHEFMPEAAWRRVATNQVVQIALVFGVANTLAGAMYDPVDVKGKINWFPVLAIVAGFACGLVTGAAVGVIVTGLSASGPWPLSAAVFMTFVPPAFVVSVGLGDFLFIGATGKWSTDFDREWWSRAGAWSSMIAFGWLALFALAFVAPLAMDELRKALNTEHAWWIYWPLVGAPLLARVLFLLPPSSGSTAAPNRLRMDRVLDAVTLIAVLGILIGIADLVNSVVLAIAAWDYADAFRWPRASAPYALTDVLLLLVPLLAVLGLAGICISVNRFSLHAMYRDRLIRTFLGASRANYPMPPWEADSDWREPRQFKERTPNDFIKFDRDDNPMLRWLAPNRKPPAVPAAGTPAATATIAPAPDATATAAAAPDAATPNAATAAAVTAGGAPPAPVAAPEAGGAAGVAKKKEITRTTPPFLLVNAALNLVGGRNLAWQERKAASFTFSPLHVGSAESEVGYRTSAEYAADVGGITLGTAMAVSGAAISPNAGAFSTPLRTFLLTLFNARLGWWLGHPDEPKAVALSGPRFAVRPMLRELLGRTDDRKPWLFVSDGGHFENLGLYEAVRRGCKAIVVIDAGCDPERKFDDLGNAIRKIRIDLNIAIKRTGPWRIGGRDLKERGAYAALFEIEYAAGKGSLLYIKSSLYPEDAKLPIDVLQYAGRSSVFPHESTSDQFFSESQFESYRALAEFAISRVFPIDDKLDSVIEAVDLAFLLHIDPLMSV